MQIKTKALYYTLSPAKRARKQWTRKKFLATQSLNFFFRGQLSIQDARFQGLSLKPREVHYATLQVNANVLKIIPDSRTYPKQGPGLYNQTFRRRDRYALRRGM